jgi:hypothetical protein
VKNWPGCQKCEGKQSQDPQEQRQPMPHFGKFRRLFLCLQQELRGCPALLLIP